MRQQLHIFPGFGIGGAQLRFAQLYEAIPEWSHRIISLNGERSAADLCGDGARLHFIDFQASPSKGLSGTAIWQLRRLIKKAEPDILCTYNWGSIEAVMANLVGAKVPNLHFEDGFGPDETDQRSTPRNLIRRLVLNRHSLTVLPSKTLETIARDEWHISPTRRRYVPNGVNTERFRPNKESRGHEEILIGSVAALRSEKNMARLLTIVDRVEGARLCLVGEGPERDVLEQQAKDMRSIVEFSGSQQDTSPYYNHFDIFALTSDTEQMPLTVLEAMASGLPILATDVGDIKHMVADENRPFIIPQTDLDGLVFALNRLCVDAELRKRLGEANRQRAVECFSQQTMLSTYHALFDDVVGQA